MVAGVSAHGVREHSPELTAAIGRARAIHDAFTRAQALAHLAWHAPFRWEILAALSTGAVDAVEEPFERAIVFAWPLRVWLDRGRGDEGARCMAEALHRAGEVGNPVGRADALKLLWDAAAPYPGPARDAALAELVAACAGAGWKAAVHLRDATLTLARHEPDAARALLAHVPEGKYRRQAESRLETGPYPEPRWFFDPRGASVD